MSYPVILNGDHAEFERENAGTPPHERPDWPMSSFDARDWAKEFCRIALLKGFDPAGENSDWMTTWFAAALMRGFDEHAARVAAAEARKAHKTMTAEEYAAMPIAGWHMVCRDYDGCGGTGVRFLAGGVLPGEGMTKDWCINMARLEDGGEIGAGALAHDPIVGDGDGKD